MHTRWYTEIADRSHANHTFDKELKSHTFQFIYYQEALIAMNLIYHQKFKKKRDYLWIHIHIRKLQESQKKT